MMVMSYVRDFLFLSCAQSQRPTKTKLSEAARHSVRECNPSCSCDTAEWPPTGPGSGAVTGFYL